MAQSEVRTRHRARKPKPLNHAHCTLAAATRLSGLYLLVAVAGCGGAAKDTTPATPSAESLADRAQLVTRWRARELPAVPMKPLVMIDGLATGEVESLVDPKPDCKATNASGTICDFKVDLGKDSDGDPANVVCSVTTDLPAYGVVLKNFLDKSGLDETPTLETRAVGEGLAVAFVANSSREVDTKTMFGTAKMAALLAHGYFTLCLDDSAGLRETFTRVTRHFFESLKFKDNPRGPAIFAYGYQERAGDRTAGFRFGALVKRGDTDPGYVESSAHFFLETDGKSWEVKDAVHVRRARPEGGHRKARRARVARREGAHLALGEAVGRQEVPPQARGGQPDQRVGVDPQGAAQHRALGGPRPPQGRIGHCAQLPVRIPGRHRLRPRVPLHHAHPDRAGRAARRSRGAHLGREEACARRRGLLEGRAPGRRARPRKEGGVDAYRVGAHSHLGRPPPDPRREERQEQDRSLMRARAAALSAILLSVPGCGGVQGVYLAGRGQVANAACETFDPLTDLSVALQTPASFGRSSELFYLVDVDDDLGALHVTARALADATAPGAGALAAKVDSLTARLTALRARLGAMFLELQKTDVVAEAALDEAATCQGVDLRDPSRPPGVIGKVDPATRETTLRANEPKVASKACEAAERLWSAARGVDLTSAVTSSSIAAHITELTLSSGTAAVRDRLAAALTDHAKALRRLGAIGASPQGSADKEIESLTALRSEVIKALDDATRACRVGTGDFERVLGGATEPRRATVTVRPKWSGPLATFAHPIEFGSGFVVRWRDASGQVEARIVTNNHVMNGAFEAEITPGDPRLAKPADAGSDRTATWSATLVQSNPHDDVAVLRLDADAQPVFAEGFALRLAPAREEESVAAAGFPGIGARPSFQVTKGTVSNARFSTNSSEANALDVYVQHTAAIDPGNSGGPLLDARGRLLGMNTFKLVGRENVGLAIPTWRNPGGAREVRRECSARPEERGGELQRGPGSSGSAPPGRCGGVALWPGPLRLGRSTTFAHGGGQLRAADASRAREPRRRRPPPRLRHDPRRGRAGRRSAPVRDVLRRSRGRCGRDGGRELPHAQGSPHPYARRGARGDAGRGLPVAPARVDGRDAARREG